MRCRSSMAVFAALSSACAFSDGDPWGRAELTLTAVFEPFTSGGESGQPEPYYFAGDAFYLPFTKLGSVERGGPILRIWEIDAS